MGVAFDVLENHKNVPIGWTKASGHLIWDVKMDFTCKARWVKDGDCTADPLGTNYAGVVSRDSVRIAFTLAAMNGLNICAMDIQNAYIQSAGRDYWLHLRSYMEYLGFSPCKADADIWMRKAKCANNTDYWEYVLLYVDNFS